MRTLRPRSGVPIVPLLSAALIALAACGSGDDEGPASQATDDEGEAEEPLLLKFRTGKEIVLNPRDQREIEVQVTPPGAHSIEFALLPDPNAPGDAVLDRSQVLSDAEGIARVTLTAPSSSSVLGLRASIDSQAIYATIRVVGAGFGALRVHPSYSGQREVTTWVASVHPEKRCEDLTGTPTEDGDLVGVSSSDAIEISKVPTTPPLAVTLRAGRFLSGCLTVDDLQEGETRTQFIPVSGIPLRLETTVLDLAIGLDPDDPALAEALDETLSGALIALRQSNFEAPLAPDDVAALLDAMQSNLIAQEPAFAAARASENWDDLVAAALEDEERTRLSDALSRWSGIGRSALFSPHAFEGRLVNLPGTPGRALLSIERIAGSSADAAGLGPEEAWSWEADASDRIALGGSLSWTPSKFLSALAIAPALAETGARNVVDALSRVYACTAVGQAIDDASPQPAATGTTCDATCLDALCRSALSTIWERVRSFSAADLERLVLTAVGSATVGNDAQAIALKGSWIGRLERSTSATTSGDLRGWAPRQVE